MGSNKQKRILIAPLDWGMGHTTRCIPLIHFLINSGHIPVFAGNEWQRTYIKETFVKINTVFLEGYNITYPNKANPGKFFILPRIPSILNSISNEKKWIDENSDNLNIDGILSDNRYGLHHSKIPSVILTHQLQIQTDCGKRTDMLLQELHYKLLNKFNSVWVVDTESEKNLGGNLSHTIKMPLNYHYIGLLSRFADKSTEEEIKGKPILILLSGPEPQRTKLSAKIWQQLQNYNGEVVYVEGADNIKHPIYVPHNIKYFKWLTHEQLYPLIKAASIVICRSGYSTIMDLVALNKKAILIPTPGQTEQEYLAKSLQEKEIFYSMKQIDFNLPEALKAAEQFPFRKMNLEDSFNIYKKVVSDWVETL